MPKYRFNSFGAQIRTLREIATVPLREVASKIGIDPSLLAKIERNQRHPSKEFIRQMALFYKVDEQAIFNEYLSDQIANKIIDEKADLAILKVAEKKVSYLKALKHEK